MPVTPGLGNLRQEDYYKFRANLGHKKRLLLFSQANLKNEKKKVIGIGENQTGYLHKKSWILCTNLNGMYEMSLVGKIILQHRIVGVQIQVCG